MDHVFIFNFLFVLIFQEHGIVNVDQLMVKSKDQLIKIDYFIYKSRLYHN